MPRCVFGRLVIVGAIAVQPALSATLTIEQRVAARATIIGFYAQHQRGSEASATPVPADLAGRQVLDDLRKSDLLRRRWHAAVSEEDVTRELTRTRAATRMPDRLHALFESLGSNDDVIREVLVRPILTDRRARSLFSRDSTIHRERAEEARLLREAVVRGEAPAETQHSTHWIERVDESVFGDSHGAAAERSVDETMGTYRLPPSEPSGAGDHAVRSLGVPTVSAVAEHRDRFEFTSTLRDASGALITTHFAVAKVPFDAWWSEVREDFNAEVDARGSERSTSDGVGWTDASPCGDVWDNGILDDIPEGAPKPKAIWTGSVAIFWGGGSHNSGRYDPVTDTWSRISGIGAPAMGSGYSAVWTGTEMIVWGGRASDPTNTGARYNPTTDQWLPTSVDGAPAPRESHTAIWTGSRMLIWGGSVPGTWFSDGGAYDPFTDSWTPVTSAGAPLARSSHTAVWTGSRMVVWGGSDDTNTVLGSGGRYDPVSGTWASVSNTQAPSARILHTAVWTGSRMVVWGGSSGSQPGSPPLGTGGRYDPDTDTWSKLSTRDAPSARFTHSAVWTGTRVLVWGGAAVSGGPYFNSGGRYDPAQDRWTAMSTTLAPSGRGGHAAVFGAGQMTIWGAAIGKDNSGGRYDPITDGWTPTSMGGAPGARAAFTAVWTGSHLIIWGGSLGGSLDTGGRYDPMLDAWSATTTSGAPSSRASHSAVWSGSRMLVWGGQNYVGLLFADGAGYDPIADAWQPLPTAGAPAARANHSASWTGMEMIVWGGGILTGATTTGGRFNPTSGTWVPTSTVSAPGARLNHTAVWTGSKMIVWGSRSQVTGLYANDGGVYDPSTDSWVPTSTMGAPGGRARHSAIWDGTRMTIWGGDRGDGIIWRTGGRYDPVADTWLPTSLVDHPLPRFSHSAVWTGSEMILWGGMFNNNYDDGFRYDPVTDVWTPISTTGVPAARDSHAAVWTGDAMLVWGGSSRNDGGRYSPPVPAPAGIATMTLGKSGATATLSWVAITDATAYDVARGSIGSLRQSSGDFAVSTDSCLANDVAGTTADDTQAPAVDNGYWYLVRPVRCSAAGSYDSADPTQVGTRDAEIAASGVACP